MTKRILGFDTSGVNALADDPDSNAIIAGLVLGYEVRLPASSVEEIAGSSRPDRRTRLLDVCQRLLTSDGSACIWPFHRVVELLINEFEQKGSTFDWRSVRVRSTEYEREIVHREMVGDELAAEQLQVVRSLEQEFAQVFNGARPRFEELFSQGTARPRTFIELLSQLQGTGGAYWLYGIGLYERVGKHRPDEAVIRQFIDNCPPFRAVVLATVLAQYERCIRDLKSGTSYRAGRIDLYMSAYLPYCDVFVTNDACQERCLREVASVGKFPTEIVGYGSLRNGLMVA